MDDTPPTDPGATSGKATDTDPDHDEARRQRGSRRLSLRIASAMVAVVALAGVAWLARYQPLAAGNAATIPGDLAEEFFQGREEVVVSYDHGETYTYGFTVQNTGPLPTTVLTVVVPGAGLLHPEEIRVAPPDDPLELDPGTMTTFEPFSLEVGAERGIRVTARFLRCDRYEGGGGIRKIGEELSVRTFVLTSTASIRLPRTIRVESPGTGTNPRPECPVVGPDVEDPTRRPSEGALELDATLVAAPEGEIWFTSLDGRPWTDCRGAIETDDDRFEAAVDRIGPLETRQIAATDFRADGRPFRSRRVRAEQLALSCTVAGDEMSGVVALRPYEPRDLDALRLPDFEYRQERRLRP